MNILVLNCGSSSLKFQVLNIVSEEVLASGLCDRIGIEGSIVNYKNKNGAKLELKEELKSHDIAIKHVLDALTNAEHGVMKNLNEIEAIGHRVVSGGEFFSDSVLIDDNVYSKIKECIPLAPLHNPAHLIGIDACKKFMPSTPNVAVFDTAFHQSMPEHAYIYATPYEWYEKYKVRRYGAHGTSHKYVSAKTAEFLGLKLEDSKIIVCHLGNGSSITAVKNGKSIDTSMGLTPLEGVMMGTRSGDIDPAILEFMAKNANLDISEIINILNKKSGALGVSGLSSDFRDLLEAKAKGDHRATLAIDIFSYRVAKYIGSYAVALGGLDAIAFTAGIGENAIDIRKFIVDHLKVLGITIDNEANSVRGAAKIISSKDSKVKVCIMPTNEELVIARDTHDVIKASK